MVVAIAALLLARPPAGEIIFTEGLAITGIAARASNPRDAVLAEMVRNGWRTPKAGDAVVTPAGERRTWQPIKSNDDGAFPQRSFARGWAFFEIERDRPEIMLLEASGAWDVYAVGEPRGADIFGYGWMRLPVKLRAGKNPFLFAPGRAPLKAKLAKPPKPLFFNIGDATLPDIVEGESGSRWGSVIVVNATESWMPELVIRTRLGDGQDEKTLVRSIPPLTCQKAAFRFHARPGLDPQELPLRISLCKENDTLDEAELKIRVRTPLQTRKVTFKSDIDGSVQYYAVHPAQTTGEGKALVLALHGARTEALEMADDYKGKDWCHIVCPTNRRPFGFDWEDIGRLDALEVLEHAQKSLHTDPLRTTLTGHSMGGHGAWINGLLFPDKWAAVAPCAAWASIYGYAAWTRSEPTTDEQRAMYSAGNASDTMALLNNGLSYPIYMHHGDKDEDVPFSESETMKAELEKIGHKSVTLNVVKDGGHWFGTESIDWPGLFSFLQDKRLTPSTDKSEVDFTTVNLAASSRAWWAQILQQERWMSPSRIRFRRGVQLEGTTENVAALRVDEDAFHPGGRRIVIDGQTIRVDSAGGLTLRRTAGRWAVVADDFRGQKNPEQIGPFREVLKNTFVFVVGTSGNDAEDHENLQLARYHAEVFLYGGNGWVEILTDRDYLRREREVRGRNVVLFGNADTNAAWRSLLSDSPVRVRRGYVTIGDREMRGADLCALVVRPRKGDDRALVAFVASTGPEGQRTLERLQLFTPGAHYPDYAVFSSDYFTTGLGSVKAAGFFDARWRLQGDGGGYSALKGNVLVQ